MKQNFSINMNHVSTNIDWIKLYVIQSKNGIIMNLGVKM